ncbi:MAG TPA: Gfo/Idh/MocA family oxidoreductase [Candidatus Hydrogenedentes bacterium]|nr:Gfo/Idh/MocA family oxidoreductase [Candidatus Hydrogenedentota bacterium]
MGKEEMKRRHFLKAAATTAAAFSIMRPRTALGSEANSKVEIGMIGCGGRGKWIADLFEKNAPAKIVAAHDYFRDRVDDVGEAFDIAPSRRHVGLDGYKALIAGKVDAIAIESPPYFHPEQTVAGLDAGKHVYLAKPIAVDAPGCLDIVKAADKAAGKLCCLVDFQTRNNEFFKGAAQRVHDGMIGDPALGHVFYHTGRLGLHAEPGTETARLRNWVFDKALSGDIIVEQNIHVIDVANWYLQSHPVKAVGTGGRKVRTDVGDCWDHFVVTFHYPNDVIVDFSSRQFGDGFDDLCIRLYGSTGTVESHYGGDVKIRGSKAGWAGGNTGNIYKEGAVNNIKDFCQAVLEGKAIQNARESADSTLSCVLGRMAAYSGEPVTWDKMLQSGERLDPKLNLPDDGPERKA